MKRTVALAIMGVAAATTAFAQGNIGISNYLTPPYNQVVWDASVPGTGGMAVNDTNVMITIWYGLGAVSEGSLTNGVSFTVDPSFTYDPGMGYGPGGYFGKQTQVVPAWVDGQDVTFQLRASGPNIDEASSRSVTWIENAAMTPDSSPGLNSEAVPGLAIFVPEPTTFALAGLGAAALLIFRRRD